MTLACIFHLLYIYIVNYCTYNGRMTAWLKSWAARQVARSLPILIGILHSYAKINNLCWMTLIILISTSELTLVFLLTRTLELNFVDIVELEWNHWSMYQTLKNDNSQINRRSTIKISHIFLTLTHLNFGNKIDPLQVLPSENRPLHPTPIMIFECFCHIVGIPADQNSPKWRSTCNIWNLAYWISDSLLY